MPSNKPHKQKHASKRAIADREQGRRVLTRPSNPKARSQSSQSGKQAAAALRAKKQQAVLQEKRLGSATGAPKVIGFIPMNESANSVVVAQNFIRCASGVEPEDLSCPHTYCAPMLKQRFTVVLNDDGNEQEICDVAKVSDILLMVLDCSVGTQQTIQELEGEVDDEGTALTGTTWFTGLGLCVTDATRTIVANMNAQGLPACVVVLQGLESHGSLKSKLRTVKLHKRYFESVFGDAVTVLPLETENDMQTTLRTVSVIKLRQLKWREQRPYIVVEGGSYDSTEKKLTIHGFLRGSSLSASQLVHITDHGTYQVESIADFGDPSPLRRTESIPRGELEVSTTETRESLLCIQANDTVEDEGFATEYDVELEREQAKKIRVPAGVSDYQAAWYEFEDKAQIDQTVEQEKENEEFHNIDIASHRSGAQSEMEFLKAADVIRHERMTDEERAEEMRKLKEMSEEDAWNPDVMDTPINLPARQRFSKFRGMKSFQTGIWDVNENLPIQYGHIFKLKGYSRVREASIEKCCSGVATPGTYVTVTLMDVSEEVWKRPGFLIASGQLEHEQKWSLVHFHVQRSSDLEGPIKSKTAMLAHIGFRKFYVAPIFSEATVGDRTKFARYFHEEDKFMLASFYGPISFNPCPILMFLVPSIEEQNEANTLQLALFGSALAPNPDLLILKRAVLTGRVAMVHKKQIVVKYMFFNEDDVKWFQPVDIYTKFGRRGKILKAVGTHGLFKAALNDQIMQHDVICMDLYKRVFPKWNTVAFNRPEITLVSEEGDSA